MNLTSCQLQQMDLELQSEGKGLTAEGIFFFFFFFFLDALSTSLDGNASVHAPCHTLCVLRYRVIIFNFQGSASAQARSDDNQPSSSTSFPPSF